MSKIRVSHKNNQIVVKTKLERTERLNQQELNIFSRRLIRGLMRPSVTGEKKITYTAPEGILLQKYLKRGINKNDLFLVFAQINEMVKKIEHYGFNMNNLVLDSQYVFVNERTREVNFIYQPIIGKSAGISIFHFLYDLIAGAVFQINEDMQCVNELSNCMNRMQFYSTMEVEKCILRIYPEIYKQVHRDNFGQSQKLTDKVAEDSGEEGTVRMDRYGWEEEETGLLINGREDDRNEGTILLNQECEETTVLKPKKYAYLIRKSSGEKISISKPSFRIGKERNYVDYFIMDNSAISRIHADIITKENGYYIRDNNSTNHTYINGNVIPDNQETEICDGNEIVLANESFEFHIN